MFEEYLVNIKLGLSFFILSLVLVKLFVWKNNKPNGKNVCVIVLGDLGRSPRMNYHCLSFANAGYNVKFIGYKGLKFLFKLRGFKNSWLYPLKKNQNKLKKSRVMNVLKLYLLNRIQKCFKVI